MNFSESEDYSSPTNASIKLDEILTKTPFSKGAFNSKSPIRSMLKKSKRRDCTPDSPQNSSTKINRFWSEEVINEESLGKSVKPTQLFSEQNKNFRKNIKLSLIEENLEEVSEKYYDFLGKQITPETLFQNLFSTDVSKTWANNEIITNINSILSELNKRNFENISLAVI